MKITRLISSLLLAALPWLPTVGHAASLGNGFNYSGRLTLNNTPANGSYDLRFRLFDDPSAGSQAGSMVTNKNVTVSSGLFTTTVDCGAGLFDGTAYWLEIAVRPGGGSSAFSVLNPRQPVGAVANAQFAVQAGTASTASGVSVNAVSGAGIQANSITAVKIAGGQVVKSLNGLTDNVALQAGANLTLTTNGNILTLAAGSSASWSLTGNAGTVPGVNFLGTTDNQPLDLYANYSRGLRLNYASRTIGGGQFALRSWSMNVLGGMDVNFIGSGVIGATISGGGYAFGSFANPSIASNSVTADFGAIGGGVGNTVSGLSGTVPGGRDNLAAGAGSLAAGRRAHAYHDGSFVWGDGTQDANSSGANQFQVLASGGINLFHGPAGVNIDQLNLNNGDFNYALRFGYGSGEAIGSKRTAGEGQYGLDFYTAFAKRMSIANNGNAWFAGDVSMASLTIRGGADLAEPFRMSEEDIPRGSVVIIDEENPGKLRVSSEPYDTRVAGIVSGANGINPGIALHQEGMIEGGQNVALSGRVYVLADATQGPIKPGDLLTTSSTPGHAMKVIEPNRAQGAILGKAMSTLKEGKGMVLVLVTLQ